MVTRHTKPISRLLIDIETVALPGVEALIPEPKIDVRLKDPDKIAAQREEKIEMAVQMAGLDADLAAVRLISTMLIPDRTTQILLVSKKLGGTAKAKEKQVSKIVKEAVDICGSAVAEAFPTGFTLTICDEMGALETTWGLLALCSGRSIGYNSLAFDWPVLLRRSMDLKVSPGITPSLAKYRDQPTTDLYGSLFNWAWEGTKKLKWLAMRYGLTVLAEGSDGSQVADMTDGELVAYGLSDLYVTEQLYRLMNGVYFDHNL